MKIELLMRRNLVRCAEIGGPPRWGKDPEYSTYASQGFVSCRSKNTLDWPVAAELLFRP